jgi:hypothetical protein
MRGFVDTTNHTVRQRLDLFDINAGRIKRPAANT